MPNTEKVAKVTALTEQIGASEALLLADYRGLTVAEAKEFRVMLAEADARFSVVKNTLMKRAADEAGVDISQMLTGPTAVTFVDGDPVLAAKRMVEAGKKFPALVLKGGYMEGKVLSEADARSLASLESREVMLSKIAGLAKGEMSKAAAMFQSLQSKFVSLATALRDKLPAEAESETPAEPEAEAPVEPEAHALVEPEAEAPADPEAATPDAADEATEEKE